MKRKLVAMLLAAAMVLSMAACGGDKPTTNESTPATGESTPAATTTESTKVEDDWTPPTSIEFVVNGNLAVTTEHNQAELIRQWEEAVGVELVITQLDHSGYRDAVGTLLAGGDYPDAMIMTAEMYAQYAPTGVLWDMTEAFENSDFYDRITKPLVNEAMKIDGRLYGFAARIGNGTLTYVKKAWLDNVGLKAEDIKTFDDYLNMLRLFTKEDPDGNGVKGDTYGVAAAGFLNLEAPYVQYLPEFWQDAFPNVYEKDGVWIDGFTEQASKDALKRIQDAYAEGLINPASLTYGTKDCRELYWSKDQVGSHGVWTYWAGMWAKNAVDGFAKNDIDTELVWIAPIEEVGKYYDRQAPVYVIFDDGDGDDRREQFIFDKLMATMVDGGEVQMLWCYGAEDVQWSKKAESFTLNAGTDKEKTYTYQEGEFHLLPDLVNTTALWSKNMNDPLLTICPLEGEYADCVDNTDILNETSNFFAQNSVMAPAAPASELYSEYSGDINDAKTKAVAKIVTEGVDVETAIAEYTATVGKQIEEVLADLNK